MIRDRENDEVFDLLELCSMKVAYAAADLLPQEVASELKDKMLLKLTGYPRKSFHELIDELKAGVTNIETATRKFLHSVTYPGKPGTFICVEVGQLAAHYQQEGEQLRDVVHIDVTSEPLYDNQALLQRLEELEEGPKAAQMLRQM